MVIFYFQKEKLNETEVPQSEIKIHVPVTTKLSPLSVKQAPTAPKLEFSFDSYVESVKGLLLRLFIALNNIHLSDIRKCLLNPRDSFICDMLMCVSVDVYVHAYVWGHISCGSLQVTVYTILIQVRYLP